MNIEIIIGFWFGCFIYCIVRLFHNLQRGKYLASKIFVLCLWMFFWAPFLALIILSEDIQKVIEILLKPENYHKK